MRGMKTVSGLTRRTGWGRQLAKCTTTPADSSQRLHTIYLPLLLSSLPPPPPSPLLAAAAIARKVHLSILLSTRQNFSPVARPKEKRKKKNLFAYITIHYTTINKRLNSFSRNSIVFCIIFRSFTLCASYNNRWAYNWLLRNWCWNTNIFFFVFRIW